MADNPSNQNSFSKNGLSKYIIVVAIACLVGIVFALILYLKPDASQQSPDVAANNALQNTANNATDEQNELAPNTDHATITFVTGLESMPGSLQGTDVDGEIIIDDQQQLVVTEGLRRLFDYFLTSQGEEELSTISRRIESYISHHTPEPAASQAIEIFRQYLKYLNAITDLDNKYSNFQLEATRNGEIDLNLIAQRKQDLSQLRQQFFKNPTIVAFFGNEDDYDDYSIAMLEIELNDTIDDDQKEAFRQDYISRMPDNTIKQNLEQQANLKTLVEETAALKAQGANAAELFRLRAKLFSTPVAIRLAEVDAKDADFDNRFKQYQAAKQQLLQPDMSENEATVQLDTLEKQLFDEAERKRLKGYGELLELEQQELNSSN